MFTIPVDTILRGLGEPVIYTRGILVKSIQGIFIRPYTPTEIAGVVVQNSSPRVVVSTSDVTGADNTATVKRAETIYKVIEVQDQDHGITELILSKD